MKLFLKEEPNKNNPCGQGRSHKREEDKDLTGKKNIKGREKENAGGDHLKGGRWKSLVNIERMPL